ncbi:MULTISPECIES: hypothetical protein [Natrialba]|uniref:Uncharacterized protein n=1 Tax=Natrialba swarupiae TaxID=2448032 RepID=A0A5D5AQ02_9EURY|nr:MULTISPECIES: hypothetical protein [Natrialba]MCW8172585.1 hypothetical protein [Natrialba swarupiae]MWV39405.1 hypothetical protein [Natrialba sp. INN-245]TYT63113.1 hypothetical protein FYC77_05590 [Natrialba swarupiae]
MSSIASLPGTAIEWYMLGAILVVVNVVGLLVTGHTLPAAFAMGLTSGLTLALVVVFLVIGWRTIRDGDSTE